MSALSYPTWDVRGRDRRAARTSLLPLRHWGRVRLLRSFHRRIAVHPDEDVLTVVTGTLQADPESLACAQAVLPGVPQEVLLALVVDRRQVAAQRERLGRSPFVGVLRDEVVRVPVVMQRVENGGTGRLRTEQSQRDQHKSEEECVPRPEPKFQRSCDR